MRRLRPFSMVLVGIAYWLLAVPGPAEEPDNSPYSAWKNGLPSAAEFFPIAVWLQYPAAAPKYKAAGFNLYVGVWKGPTEQQLTELQRHGMRVICAQNAGTL